MCNKYEKKKVDFYKWKWAKKGDFENPKVIYCDFILNQSPLSTIFAIVRFPGSPKLVLSGDPLFVKKFYRFGIPDWWKHLMNSLGVWVIESLYFEVSKLVWTLCTLVMTILGLKSSFFCMIWVFFPMMGRLVLERMYDRSAIQRKNKDWKW